MVRKGVVAADVGTDHAYLPSYLILNGIVPKAIACDLRKKPLMNAQQSVDRYGLSDKIELRLSDGLDEIKKGEVQDVIMAGMGGTLTADIMARADWLKSSDVHLILQPMTHAEDVRKYLCENNFEILKEDVCTDEGRTYIAINAYYTGVKREYPDGYEFYGEQDCENELSKAYILKQYKRIKKRAESLKAAGIKEDEMLYCEKSCRGIEKFLGLEG